MLFFFKITKDCTSNPNGEKCLPANPNLPNVKTIFVKSSQKSNLNFSSFLFDIYLNLYFLPPVCARLAATSERAPVISSRRTSPLTQARGGGGGGKGTPSGQAQVPKAPTPKKKNPNVPPSLPTTAAAAMGDATPSAPVIPTPETGR